MDLTPPLLALTHRVPMTQVNAVSDSAQVLCENDCKDGNFDGPDRRMTDTFDIIPAARGVLRP